MAEATVDANPRAESRPQRDWIGGNALELLENGEAYFPSVFAAIRAARHEVLIETFILWEDEVGLELQRVLIEAAQRGVRVDLGVDGWGAANLSDQYIQPLSTAGVQVRMYDPKRWWAGMRLHVFRRMHRKIVVIDGRVAFVGGINFSGDHLRKFGAEAKQDYSLRVEGPLAARIRAFAIAQLDASGRTGRATLPQPEPAGNSEAMLLTRDNYRNRDAIERAYRAAIHAAREEVIIANAYFFPGYRLLKAMRRAARRGVRVHLVLQGQPDMPIVKHLAATLHAQLLRAGVVIHEYCARPLHGKVALVDEAWATVGSSNLDPLSLSFNLEANVMVRDPEFVRSMAASLHRLIDDECHRLEFAEVSARRSGLLAVVDFIAYHVTRHFPAWAGWLPAHTKRLEPIVQATRRDDDAQRGRHEPYARFR